MSDLPLPLPAIPMSGVRLTVGVRGRRSHLPGTACFLGSVAALLLILWGLLSLGPRPACGACAVVGQHASCASLCELWVPATHVSHLGPVLDWRCAGPSLEVHVFASGSLRIKKNSIRVFNY
jgi:hypothetical protein